MRNRASLSVAVIAGALYIITLAPTITWANAGTDGGDLITAAATLGVPHPPGYPLYITLGHLFAQLPIGNVALRMNLFSAMCMALTAALITWSLSPIPNLPPSSKSSGQERVGVGVSILAGLTFAVAPMVWGQATSAEVHALNALLVALILALLAPIVVRGKPIASHRLSVACFVWGLSVTHQLTALALAPLFFVVVGRAIVIAQPAGGTRHSSRLPPRALRITPYAFFFLLPLTLYLLLLPRAAAQPPINWLGEATPANFWSFITAEVYRGYAFALPPSGYPARLVAFAQLLMMQFGWIGLGLIGLGVYRTRRHALAPMLSIALYVIFALGYNTADSYLYLIPVWLWCAYAIAAGAQAFMQHTARLTRHSSLVAVLLILLIPGLSVANNFTAQDLHADRTAEQFAQRVLAAAPADALLITHLDAHTFTLWYYRHVEAQRPDVAVIDARLAAFPWYDPMLQAQNQALNVVEFDPEATWLARLRAANPMRPVCDLDAVSAQLVCQP